MNEQEMTFFINITRKLPEKSLEQLKQLIDTYDYEEGETFIEALFYALVSLNPEEHWLLMQLDVKGLDELVWQANAMARTHELTAEFALDGEDNVEEGLQAFNDWLSLKQFVFLQYNDFSDSYYGFISRKNQSKRIIESAAKAGITLAAMPARPKLSGDFIFTRTKRSPATMKNSVIKQLTERAKKKEYRAIMYIAMPDCEPCQAFEQLLDHPVLNEALKHTSIFRVDALHWLNYINQQGLDPKVAPTFIAFTKEGEISENISLKDSLWEENTARQMASFFKHFLADERNDVPLRLSREERCKTLQYALANQDLSEIRRLIEVDQCDCDTLICYGKTVLHYAAEWDQTESSLQLLEFLLDRCSLLDARWDSLGCTALHLAIEKLNQQAAIQLIEKGASVQLGDDAGKTPLHEATRKADRFTDELFELLIEKGANVNAQDKKGDTPLHEATSFGQRLAPYLLDKGADPNLQNNHGESPLHRAARFFNRDKAHALIRLYLQYGGDLNLKGIKGQAARELIVEKDGPEVLEMFLSGGE
ncbi:ankyrin repeat domain-containing protein [Marinobacterium iners]|uniref:Ankyrin repeat n=1 Tax=Marinobacterium iners DSM 11526 TaxID=1122198 RepID=A0A1H4B1V7_9GAMM|nr:ankyrin repeat domain-containing protein [Marinobacterium iners]SEA41872.1 Ankyrin repeat [Marinobacterium iners DSM 11526]